jgi:hypothetical protein
MSVQKWQEESGGFLQNMEGICGGMHLVFSMGFGKNFTALLV